MSTSHAEHDHGHGSANGDHVPHVLPLSTYIATFGTLLVLTVITVGASYVNLGHMGNLIVALLIATAKATTVALIFMHLKWDHKFHSIIFVSALLFLAVFIGITMSDTEFRGEAESIEGRAPLDIKDPHKGERKGDLNLNVAAPASAAPAAGSAAPATAPAKH